MRSFDEKHTKGALTSSKRADGDVLLARAAFLRPDERMLIQQNLSLGMSVRELAVLHRVDASALRRKIRRLKKILAHPCFPLAAKFPERLPEPVRNVALDHFVGGYSLGLLARRHRMSLHRVRQLLAVARVMLLVMPARFDPAPTVLPGTDESTLDAIERAARVQLRRHAGEPAISLRHLPRQVVDIKTTGIATDEHR